MAGCNVCIISKMKEHFFVMSMYERDAPHRAVRIRGHRPPQAREERIVGEALTFADRREFREWLSAHGASSEGVWLLFGKAGGPQTLKAAEALEEALCFGWIDGQMRKIDEVSYKKYFAQRRPKSRWSEKNKALVGELEARGLMTEAGRAKVEEARRNGQWDALKPADVTEEQIARIDALLKGHEPACGNIRALSPSVRRTYARAYYDAKTDAGREKRFAWMVARLDENLKPM